MTTKTATKDTAKAPTTTAAASAEAAQRHHDELEYELRVTIPHAEREAKEKAQTARERGDMAEATAQKQVGFDLAKRNNEIIRTLLPAARTALADRRQEARHAAYGAPPDPANADLDELEDAMESAEGALRQLEAEVDGLPARLRETVLAGDAQATIALHRRREELPALISGTQASALRARFRYAYVRANRPRPEMPALEEALEEAKANLEQAQAEYDQARGRVLAATDEESEARSQVRQAEYALSDFLSRTRS